MNTNDFDQQVTLNFCFIKMAEYVYKLFLLDLPSPLSVFRGKKFHYQDEFLKQKLTTHNTTNRTMYSRLNRTKYRNERPIAMNHRKVSRKSY